MNKSIIIISVIILLYGCKTKVSDSLLSKAKQECFKESQSREVVVLKNITKFSWDYMYVFGDWATSDSIAKFIGFDYNSSDVEDDCSRMLFVSNKKVVYQEDFKSFSYDKSTIDFQDASD